MEINMEINMGDIPYYSLAKVGRGNLCGFYPGRYRDQDLMIAQFKYCLALFWKLSMVLFGWLGDVTDEIENVPLVPLLSFKMDFRFGY